MPSRRTVRVSNVPDIRTLPYPVVMIVVTQRTASGSPAQAAATNLVTRIQNKAYNRSTTLVVTATKRALQQLEDRAQVNGVNIANEQIPFAVKYTRTPAGHRRKIFRGVNQILFALPTPMPQPGSSPSKAGSGPQTFSSAAQSLGDSGSQAFFSPPQSLAGSGGQSRPGSGSQNRSGGQSRPGSGAQANVQNIRNRSRDGDLYTAFRVLLGNKENRKRKVAVILVKNGHEAAEFIYNLQGMQEMLKDKMGAYALFPTEKKKPLANNVRNDIARILAPEFARARGRSFAIIMVYASGSDPAAKHLWAQKKMKRILVCYTPGALLQAAGSGPNALLS